MATKIEVLDPASHDKLRRHVQRLERMLHDLRQVVMADRRGGVTPAHYVAKAPAGGIPAGSEDTPGTADCQVYRVLASGDFEQAGFTEEVSNLSGPVPAGAYVVLGRDNFGTFVHKHTARFWRFTLNEDMGATTTNQGAADLLEMDGTETGMDVTLQDPLAIFASLVDTDAGYCLEQDGKFYIIQAPC